MDVIVVLGVDGSKYGDCELLGPVTVVCAFNTLEQTKPRLKMDLCRFDFIVRSFFDKTTCTMMLGS